MYGKRSSKCMADVLYRVNLINDIYAQYNISNQGIKSLLYAHLQTLTELKIIKLSVLHVYNCTFYIKLK